jgi:hypothetical protein
MAEPVALGADRRVIARAMPAKVSFQAPKLRSLVGITDV